jgi:hypothetical protein
MIINNAPQNEAIVSNVGEIGEFRIRNSAKAFNILSSGLYANKIRAIIRELSCNAVDSHTAAGKQSTPFDVHLPNTLEPHFSIRDYGTGLTHEQVTQIYTTYFESTKTESNEFIGALGLGSKSPFSYTDNFTVTAIKDGKKGIYSAFINGSGVPSIALMMQEETTEPSGVEVKFSVNDRWDFDKFRSEASHVYRYFTLRPVVSGASGFEFRDIAYKEKDIVPGVNQMDSGSSVAVMGNIAYPIDVPNMNENLGELAQLLRCSLEIRFEIGDLDFQASREGLSYIPQTIEAIKARLQEVNDVLETRLAERAAEYTNPWDKAIWLSKQRDNYLWATAAMALITNSKNPLFNHNPGSWEHGRLANLKLDTAHLAKKYNMELRGFQKNRGSATCSTIKSNVDFDHTTKITKAYWGISVQSGTVFIKNDTKVGATERAKHHWRKTVFEKDAPYTHNVYVMEPVDKTKPVKYDEFFKEIHFPPNVMQASALLTKERAASQTGKNVSILKLQERGHGGYYRSKEVVWRDAGKADQFDATKTHYYLPLSGYSVISKIGNNFSAKDFIQDLDRAGLGALKIDVLGVRKGDLEFIKKQKNWVNAEDYVERILKKVTDEQKLSLAFSSVDRNQLVAYNKTVVQNVDSNSLYAITMNKLANALKVEFTEFSLNRLCAKYKIELSLVALRQELLDESTAVYARYPLLSSLNNCNNHLAIAEYINLIDAKKGE